MSKSAIETLKLIGLLDKNGKVGDIDKIDPSKLQDLVDYYRRSRIDAADKDSFESTPDNRDLAAVLSSVSASNNVGALMPSCFLYNRIYANDPLVSLARDPNDVSIAHRELLGFDNEGIADPYRVANKLLYFEKLAPLIELGAVTLLPLEELHAPPTDGLPLFATEDWFRSDVPAHIHDFIHQNAVVREMKPANNGKGLIVLDGPPNSPTRGICINFENDQPVTASNIYNLWETEILEKVDDSHLKMAQSIPWDKPPNKSMFDAWVYQSINKSIIARLDSISREVSFAAQLHANYLTESQFEASICGMTSENELKAGQEVNAVNFLKANAPYLKIDDPVMLAKLRNDYSSLFERWQLTLLSVSDELSGEGNNFDQRAKQLFEKEIRPQITELNTALLKMAGGATGAALLTAGTIGMAVMSGATLPFAAVLGLGVLTAGGRAIPSAAEYITQRKGPAFIWSKLTRKKLGK